MEFTGNKRSNSSVQSVVEARRQTSVNPEPSIIAETRYLLANLSQGYQIMDRS